MLRGVCPIDMLSPAHSLPLAPSYLPKSSCQSFVLVSRRHPSSACTRKRILRHCPTAVVIPGGGVQQSACVLVRAQESGEKKCGRGGGVVLWWANKKDGAVRWRVRTGKHGGTEKNHTKCIFHKSLFPCPTKAAQHETSPRASSSYSGAVVFSKVLLAFHIVLISALHFWCPCFFLYS